ncbi:MAG: tetratricopeptide repeat protein [Longimicrobiales bacterium]|nr:tetratricopeptide repeat protein [Longimicrobiales bacterium]
MNLDQLRSLLPDLRELDPLWTGLIERSSPDPARAWSGSGDLGTLGSRLVDPEQVGEVAEDVARKEAERLARLYASVAEALRKVERGDPEGAAAALIEAAEMEEGSERHDRAEALAWAAFQAVRDLRDQKPAALALRRAARAARSRGKLGRAAERYRRAHSMARDSFDPSGAAEAAVGMGNVLEQQGAWAEADAWYRRALASLEGLGEPTAQRWHALLNIHITLRSRGRVEESVEWLERAEGHARQLEDSGAEVYLSNARGQLQMARGDFTGAEEYFRRALARTGAAESAVVVQINLAEALLAQDRILEATEEAREAERRAVVQGVLPRLPEVYRLLGRTASRDGNPEAFVFFERALTLVEEHGLPELEEAMTLQAYGVLERERGNREAARELEARAAECYEELGIENPRGPWSDTFGTQGPSDKTEERRDDG